MGWVKVTGWERDMQVIITGATNLCMLPAAWLAYQYRLPIDAVVGLFTMVTSGTYHVLQTTESEFLRGKEGEWHRADNIFAITTFMFILLQIAQIEHEETLILIKLFCLAFATTLQCLAPWDLDYTVTPIVLTGVCVIAWRVYLRKLPEVRKRSGFGALVCLACAMLCFSKGLDDNNDYLRLWHGCWHISVSAFAWFMTRAFHPPQLLNRRKKKLDALRTYEMSMSLTGGAYASKKETPDYNPSIFHGSNGEQFSMNGNAGSPTVRHISGSSSGSFDNTNSWQLQGAKVAAYGNGGSTGYPAAAAYGFGGGSYPASNGAYNPSQASPGWQSSQVTSRGGAANAVQSASAFAGVQLPSFGFGQRSKAHGM